VAQQQLDCVQISADDRPVQCGLTAAWRCQIGGLSYQELYNAVSAICGSSNPAAEPRAETKFGLAVNRVGGERNYDVNRRSSAIGL